MEGGELYRGERKEGETERGRERGRRVNNNVSMTASTSMATDHCIDISNAFKGVIQSTICHLHQHLRTTQCV